MRTAKLLSLAFVVAFAPSAFAAPIFINNQFVVNADGTLARGGKAGVIHSGTGQYEVDSENVKTCAYVVTAGSSDTTVPSPAVATAVRKLGQQNAILISTYDNRGNAIDSGFHLIVRCVDATLDGAAVVDPDGTLARGVFASSATRADVGEYTVAFNNASIPTACAYTATIGLSASAGVSAPGLVTVAQAGNGNVAVRTYDVKGNPADLGFHVFAACNR
jgi:hypothetical protein